LLIGLFVIGTGYNGINAIHQLQEEIQSFESETLPVVETLNELKQAALRISASTNELLLIDSYTTNNSDDQTQSEKELKLIHLGVTNYKKQLVRYHQLISAYFHAETIYVREILRQSEKFLTDSQTILAMRNENLSKATLMTAKEQFEDSEIILFSRINEAIVHERFEVIEKHNEIKLAVEKSIGTIFSWTIISITAALVAGLLMSHFILLPVKRLSAATKSISNGNLDSRIEVNTKDELGSLSESFNNMALALSQHEEQQTELMNEKTKAQEKAEAASHAKTEFLANMSHELRTPVHAILSFSALGANKVQLCDKQAMEKYYSAINDSGKRLMSLINNLLDLSKFKAGDMKYSYSNVSLLDITEKAVEDFLNSRDDGNQINISVESNDSNTQTSVDVGKIMQVIDNLLSNCVKYSHNDKNFQISIKQTTLSVDTENPDDRDVDGVAFSISDNGVGIPENELDSIFEGFFQSSKTNTHAGGTGLGLSICKQIIEDHNGNIFAEDNSHKGATFTFILPQEHIRKNAE